MSWGIEKIPKTVAENTMFSCGGVTKIDKKTPPTYLLIEKWLSIASLLKMSQHHRAQSHTLLYHQKHRTPNYKTLTHSCSTNIQRTKKKQDRTLVRVKKMFGYRNIYLQFSYDHGF